MKLHVKILAVVLIIAVLTTSLFLYFRHREREKSQDTIKIENLVNAVIDSSEVIKPERPYEFIDKATDNQEPLQKVLMSDHIEYYQIFANEQIESIILNASSLTDIAKSKKEIEGLKEVRNQIQSALKGYKSDDKKTGDLNSFPSGIEMISEASQIPRMEKLLTKLEELFKPIPLQVDPEISSPIKGTWTKPDKIVLRWTPQNGWKPDGGYNLYRILNGNIELIGDGLGSNNKVIQLVNSGLNFPSYARELFEAALLTQDKMQVLGIGSELEFQQKYYPAQSAASALRITGKNAFTIERTNTFFNTPGTIMEKIPESDIMENKTVYFAGEMNARVMSIDEFNTQSEYEPVNLYGILPVLTEEQSITNKILSARRTILTNVFINDEFANSSGFGYEDDLTNKEININDFVRYIVVPMEGENTNLTDAQIASGNLDEGIYSISVKYGVEKPVETPDELDGYGADQKVYLRWKAPETSAARSIISGYHIERRKKDETEFIRINSSPVVISYTDDDDGILYETASFYIDENLENGSEYVYRVQAMDIFGRLSDYSDELPVKVYKVTPPVQPVLGMPEISVKTSSFTLPVNEHLFQVNAEVPGVALPITGSSQDTDSFVIYRSEVCGNGQFGIPKELVRINMKPYAETTAPVYSTNGSNGIFVIRPSLTLQSGSNGAENLQKISLVDKIKMQQKLDTVYYDSAVQPGFYYKYWVAAVDSFGNESQWSDGQIIGYPLADKPENPVNPIASMNHNEQVVGSSDKPPGFFREPARNPGVKADITGFLEENGIDVSGLLGENKGDISSVLNKNNIDITDLLDKTAGDISYMLGNGGSNSTDISGILNNQNTQMTSQNESSGNVSGTNTYLNYLLNSEQVSSDLRPTLLKSGVSVVGYSASDAVRHDNNLSPAILSLELNNLPKPRDIHRIIALKKSDLGANGSFQFTWDHYDGDGLAGYNIYAAESGNLSEEALRNMTKEEIIEAFNWSLAEKNIKINQFSHKVNPKDNTLYIFMVCLVPKESPDKLRDEFNQFLPAGWVRLDWKRPDDPQVSFFRVYRVEVPYFSENDDYSRFKWNLVADNVRYTVYSEKVDQNCAHFYYYKVTSVSIWGEESEGTVSQYRVPATVAPQAPAMMVPFSKKGQNQINWLGVPHANKYIIYRKLLPKPIELSGNDNLNISKTELFREMFNESYLEERFDSRINPADVMTQIIGTAEQVQTVTADITGSLAQTQSTISSAVSSSKAAPLGTRFKTEQVLSFSAFRSRISEVPLKDKQTLLNMILNDKGILAAVPYSFLDEDQLKSLDWEVAGEVIIKPGEDSSGEKSFTDVNVIYGSTYLYTVQAANDDNLVSDRPEPVSVFTRKGEPFSPVENLGFKTGLRGHPAIYWDPPHNPYILDNNQKYMENYIIDEDGKRNTAGYLVYRSDSRDGVYYQVSGLITDSREFTDMEVFVSGGYWYKVKVVDTAGYISDFSEPLHVMQSSENADADFQYNNAEDMNEGEYAQTILASLVNSIVEEFIGGITLSSEKADKTLAKGLKPVTPTPTQDDGKQPDKTPTINLVTPTPGLQLVTPTPIPTTIIKPVTPTPIPGGDNPPTTSPIPTQIVKPVTPTPIPSGDNPPTTSPIPTQTVKPVTPTPIPTTIIKPVTPTPIPGGDNPPTTSPIPTQTVKPVTPTPIPGGDNPPTATPTPTPIVKPATPTPTPGENKPPSVSPIPTAIPPIQYTTPTPGLTFTTPVPTPSLGVSTVTMKLNDFTIAGIPVTALSNGYGKAMLVLDQFLIPVYVTIRSYDGDRITLGTASLADICAVGDTGIELTSLELEAGNTLDAIVSGKVEKTGGYLAGTLKSLPFSNARLSANGVIHINASPMLHYGNLKFKNSGKVTINFGNLDGENPFGNLTGTLDDIYGPGFINFHRGIAENNLGLETIDNIGLEYSYDTVYFDSNGNLTGRFTINEAKKMKVVIPAGLCIKAMDSVLEYKDGQVIPSKSYITGRILTPFETWTDETEDESAEDVLNVRHSISEERLAQLRNGNFGSTSQEMALLDSILYYMAQQELANALLVFPDDPISEETRSAVPFTVRNWDGAGFVINDATMTPSNIPLYDINKVDLDENPEQREAVLGLSPINVAVDIRRDAVYQGEAPADTKIPEWMGIVIKSGNVALPPSFVQNRDGSRIRFYLTSGEFLYDQNGFCYQNQAYTPEGVPAQFGESLGNFKDVLVRNVVMDLYNNIADVEIEADVYVDLFRHRVNVKMLKDDQGKFVCNVGETEEFDPAGDEKVKITVNGGRVDSLGMHTNGLISISIGNNGEELKLDSAQFSNLLIPSDPRFMISGYNGIYGKAVLDKPCMMMFHDFPMELRGFELYNIYGDVEDGPYYHTNAEWVSTTMNLWGGMQLSDNMQLNANRDLDIIVVQNVFNQPAVAYEDSHSEVVMVFEDFAELTSRGTPTKKNPNGDYIEYDTGDPLELENQKNCEFGLSCSNALDITVEGFEFNTRIGYDKLNQRCYFAVSVYYTGPGISFCCGEAYNFGGLIAYNMDMGPYKKPDGTFDIPSSNTALIDMVDHMQVSRGEENYLFAAACSIRMGYRGLTIGELRNVYLCVEKGPSLEMGAFFYGPNSIDDLEGNGSGLVEMGTASIGYYHPVSKFKFSLSLHNFGMYGIAVSGDLGYETCPEYWEVRVGYPEMISAKVGPLYGGLGLLMGNRDQFYVEAKAHIGFDISADIDIVSVGGFLEAGGEGKYHSGSTNSPSLILLSAYIKGGIHGSVLGHDVIRLMLEANGEISKTGNSSWTVRAGARISYHVDLVVDLSGSVHWDLKYEFG